MVKCEIYVFMYISKKNIRENITNDVEDTLQILMSNTSGLIVTNATKECIC